MGSTDIAALAVAAVFAGAGLFVLRPLLIAVKAVDIPVARSSHTRPVVRGGGLAAALGVLLAAGILLGAGWNALTAVLVVAVAFSAVGFLDDVAEVSVRVRLTAQLALGVAGSWLILSELRAESLLGVGLASFAIVAYVNISNFMDGLNGMSALHGIAAGAALASAGALSGLSWLITGGLILMVSFGLFLPWNLAKLPTFLGDVGSYLLGAMIAAMVIAGVAAGLPLVTVAGATAIYLADTGITLVRRVLRKEKVWQAHRSHLYQRVSASGVGHMRVSLVVAAFSATSAAAGLTALGALPEIAATVIVLVLMIAYVLSMTIWERRRNAA